MLHSRKYFIWFCFGLGNSEDMEKYVEIGGEWWRCTVLPKKL